MTTRTIPVALALSGEASTTGEVTLQDRSLPMRLARALVALLGSWAVAGACIFVPVAHFVLVPAFVGVGLVLGVVRLRDDVSLIAAQGMCPRCHVQRKLEASGRFRDGTTVHCDGCGCQIAASSAA